MRIPISGKLFGQLQINHLMDRMKPTRMKMTSIQDGQVATSLTSDNQWMFQLGPWSINSKMFQMMLFLILCVFVVLLMVCERVVVLMRVIQAILKILKASLIFAAWTLQWLVILLLSVTQLIVLPINVISLMLLKSLGRLQRRLDS